MRKIFLIITFFAALANAEENYSDSLNISYITVYKIFKTQNMKFTDNIAFKGTEQVYLDNILLEKDIDYSIDYIRGTIHFMIPPSPDDSVKITFQFLPIDIPKRYSLFKKVKEDSTKSIKYELIDTTDSEGVEARISIKGNKTIGVRLSEGGSLEMMQTLDAAIEGYLGDETEISGYLQDNELPYSEEGSSASLAEVDKIFFQIKYRDYLARIEDLEINRDEGHLTAYSGKLQGIEGKKYEKATPASAEVNYAITNGEFMRTEFLGDEGIQGPYELRGKYGEEKIFLVSGSIKVYVDGILKEVGKDYYIDYNNGSVTFTSQIPIHSDTRIYVEYSYVLGKFRRIMTGASADIPIDKERKNHVGFSIISEKDSPYSTYGEEFTEEDLDFFRKNYEKGKPVYIPGGKYEGENKGDYFRINRTDGSYYYRYAGFHKGDWSVIFTEVDEGEGDYRYSHSIAAYEYTGEGRGNYVAMIPYAPPQRREMAEVRVDLNPSRFFSFIAETAISSFNENILFDETSKREIKGAGDGKIVIGEENLKQLFLEAEIHKRQPEFSPFIYNETSDFQSSWLLTPEDSLSSYTSGISNANVPFLRKYRVGAKSGFFKGHGFSDNEGASWNGKMIEGNIGGDIFKDLTIFSRTGYIKNMQDKFYLEDELYRKYYDLETSYRYRFISPKLDGSLIWAKEFSDSTTLNLPYRQQEASGRIEFSKEKKWLIYPFASADRRELSYDEGYMLGKRSWEAGFQGEAAEELSFKPRLRFVHSVQKYFKDTGESGYTDLAEAGLFYLSDSKSLQIDLSYILSTKMATMREARYEQTDEGMGQYSRDENTGEFYPDEDGDYRRYFVDVGDKEKRGSVSLSSNTTIMPPSSKKDNIIQDRLWKLDIISEITEEETDPSISSLALLDITEFQKDNCKNGRQMLETKGTLFPDKTDFQPAVTVKLEKSLSGDELGYIKYNRLWSISPYIKVDKYTPWHLDLTGFYQRETEEIPEYYLFRIITTEIIPKAAYDIRKNLTPFVSFSAKRQTETERNIILTGLTPTIGLDYGFMKGANLHSEVSLIERKSNTEDIPVQLFIDEERGLTKLWLLNIDYRLSQNMLATLHYQGRKKPEIPARHYGELVMRFLF
ncbi:MAG: hypothetical protein JXA60_02755 [Candidatus Coatesbacteria bacterium]|nr:hypothetical protein [Candidatus Coatesbacteria bacterium]